jgi:hypothetical protein
MATPTCRSITAVSVDEAVAERLLEALNPEEVPLALAAADEVCDRRARRSRAAKLELGGRWPRGSPAGLGVSSPKSLPSSPMSRREAVVVRGFALGGR